MTPFWQQEAENVKESDFFKLLNGEQTINPAPLVKKKNCLLLN